MGDGGGDGAQQQQLLPIQLDYDIILIHISFLPSTKHQKQMVVEIIQVLKFIAVMLIKPKDQ